MLLLLLLFIFKFLPVDLISLLKTFQEAEIVLVSCHSLELNFGNTNRKFLLKESLKTLKRGFIYSLTAKWSRDSRVEQ